MSRWVASPSNKVAPSRQCSSASAGNSKSASDDDDRSETEDSPSPPSRPCPLTHRAVPHLRSLLVSGVQGWPAAPRPLTPTERPVCVGVASDVPQFKYLRNETARFAGSDRPPAPLAPPASAVSLRVKHV